MGPDLLLVDAREIGSLADAGLIQDLAGRSGAETRRFLPDALQMVSDGGKRFGLPFALHTQVFFYNKNLVDKAPTTLGELMASVAAGNKVALKSGFADAFWGLGAFDGEAFDANGRLSLAQGGFLNWLDFLVAIQSLPGFMIDEDGSRLRRAFENGEVAYYAADSSDMSSLLAVLGDGLGVAPLPSGRGNSVATPVLQTDAFVFSNAASPDETALAIDLANYLTDAQSQFRLATANIGRAPANAKVRVNQNLPPEVVALMRQVRSARPIALEHRGLWNEVTDPNGLFSDGYRKVLAGVISPGDFVNRTIWQIAGHYGVELAPSGVRARCPSHPAPITVWHTLQPDEEAVFELIAASFATACPDAEVTLVHREPDTFYNDYVSAVRAGNGPDAIYEASRWMPQLADQELLRELSDLAKPSALQQFIPGAADAMHYQGRLYGIPESVSVLALYYNRAQIQRTADDLDELLLQVDVDHRMAMPATFFDGYWGMSLFGGFTFDPTTGLVLDSTGLKDWLTWLQAAQRRAGFDVYADRNVAEAQFAKGDAAYFVSGPWSLARLRQEMGQGAFGVVPLPGGTRGPGSPMLQVLGVMVNAQASEPAAETAVAFAEYLNTPDSQTLLLQTGSHVSAGVNLDLTGYSQISGFREQAKIAGPVIENAKFAIIEEHGNLLYRQVLQDHADPAQAVEKFTADVAQANLSTQP